MSEQENANGTAGASARREHQRRKARREAAVREAHPRTAGLRLALKDAPQHETAWARGGGGEELVAQALAKRCPQIPVLHDRRIPGSRANIDHIAVAATGVWVIDAKRYTGKLQIAKPLFGKPALKIGGRDKTKLVDGLAMQVELLPRRSPPSGSTRPSTAACASSTPTCRCSAHPRSAACTSSAASGSPNT